MDLLRFQKWKGLPFIPFFFHLKKEKLILLGKYCTLSVPQTFELLEEGTWMLVN